MSEKKSDQGQAGLTVTDVLNEMSHEDMRRIVGGGMQQQSGATFKSLPIPSVRPGIAFPVPIVTRPAYKS